MILSEKRFESLLSLIKDWTQTQSIYFFSTNLETSAEIDSYFESRTQHSSIMISNDVNSLDLLYHTDKLTDFKRLFIFSSCIKNILQITHDDDQSEFAKCFEIVSKAWYIRELIKHLRNFIRHCLQCLTLQIRRHKSFNSLQLINSSLVSFHIIILNFILTLSRIHDDINTIMSITNRFTKRITMLTDKMTYNVEQWTLALLDRLNIVDWRYSKIIIFNKNKKILSNLWKTIFNRLNINLLYSTFYHFQTDDSSERINQTAEITLRYYIHDLKKLNLWSKTLSMFQIVMNNSRLSTTIKTFNEISYEFTSNRSLNLNVMKFQHLSICYYIVVTMWMNEKKWKTIWKFLSLYAHYLILMKILKLI